MTNKIEINNKIKYNFFILFSLLFCCNKIDESIVFGSGCKLWMKLNTFGAGIVCIDSNKHFQTYGIKHNGTIYKPFPSDFIDEVLDKGTWNIKNDSLYLNEHKIHKSNIFEDSIYLNHINIYLKNVTYMFNIKKCDCYELNAQLKEGSVGDFNQLLMLNHK
ncbi:MAG: hypothetical protein ACKVU2_18415 [Saprospiraceae bacterium]